MCFSNKINTKAMQDTLKQLVTQRKKYTEKNQLSNFLLCMLEYMQMILSHKAGLSVFQTQKKGLCSCLPCFSNSASYRNVRKQFQKAYEECNNKQMLDYYQKFVNYLTGNNIKIPNETPNTSLPNQSKLQSEGDIIFNIQVKGKITWTKEFSMTLSPQRNCLTLKSSTTGQQTVLNLRNYIFRLSKHVKQNSYVLCSIVPIAPHKLRFSISNNSLNGPMILQKIQKSVDNALKQNVNLWKQPVSHIENIRAQQILAKQNMGNLIDKKSESEALRPVKVASPTNIKNPLKNMVIDKAKIGLVKKVKQFKQNEEQALSKQDNKSKRDRLSSTPSNTPRKSEQLKLFDIDKGDSFNTKGKQFQKKAENKSEDILQNKKFGTNSIQDAFKKKPKQPQSQNQFISNNQFEDIRNNRIAKPQFSFNNYAQHPNKTHSQYGTGLMNQVNSIKKLELKSIKNKDKNMDEMEGPDSAKSLLNDLEKAIIFQQQQEFGNASQLQSESHFQSFQTIPQPID